MPLCHQCRWNAEPPTAEKTAACTACDGPGESLTHKGRVHVSIDAGGPQTAAEVEASLQKLKADAEAAAEAEALHLPDCCRQTALALLDYMDGLTGQELKVLVEVAHGASLADIGAAGGVERKRPRRDGKQTYTRAMISKLWRGILEKFPDLAGVLVTGISNNARESIRRRDAKRKAALAWAKASRANASGEP